MCTHGGSEEGKSPCVLPDTHHPCRLPASAKRQLCIFPFPFSGKPAAPNFTLTSFILLPCCDTQTSNTISHHDQWWEYPTSQHSTFLLSSSCPSLPVAQLAFIWFFNKDQNSHSANGDSKFEKSDVVMKVKWKDEHVTPRLSRQFL